MSLENNLKEKENKIVEIKENENISTDIIETKKLLVHINIWNFVINFYYNIINNIFNILIFKYEK